MNLYFYKFNNYYNRVIKSYPNLNDYGEPVETMTGNVNFYSVNGVIANQVVNHTEQQIANYDYMLVLDDYYQIVSRWFVLDYARTNSQRATLNLRRDLIADNWDNVLNNDMMYIEKGTTNINDPKFFNEENLVINKRKIAELPLETVAWAVAITRPNTKFSETTANLTKFNATSVSIMTQAYKNFIDEVKTSGYNLINYYNGQLRIGFVDGTYYGSIVFENDSVRLVKGDNGHTCIKGKRSDIQKLINLYKGNINKSVSNNNYVFSDAQINESSGLAYNGYNATFNNAIADNTSFTITPSYFKSLFDLSTIDDPDFISTYADSKIAMNWGRTMNFTTKNCYEGVIVTGGSSESIVNTEYTFTGSRTDQQPFNMPNVNDSYGILAMPLVNRVRYYPYDSNIYDLPNKETIISIFQGMSSLNEIIDVQIIPAGLKLNVSGESASGIQVIDSNIKVCYIQYGSNKYPLVALYNNSIEAAVGLPLDNYVDLSSKAQMIGTDFELASGNYNNTQTIYPYQNQQNSGFTQFYIEGTIKPFSTMMRVRFLYEGLNGSNFLDKQGLLINDGFDVTKLTDAWQNYVYNNKNYQKQFDADYKMQEKSFNYGLVSSGIGILGDTLQGASQGAQMGGGYGAIAGGVVGGIQGGYNFFESYDLGKSQLKLSKKQFKFNLDNIKSQASNVTSVGDVNFLNKIWPMVNIYQSPNIIDIENYLQFNGMTINAIGNIIDYIKPNEPSFIKATIIRTNIGYSPNIINELNAELEKGIYILKEES